jgi:hypothetical protein
MSESSVLLSSFHSRTIPLSTSWLYEDRRIMLESRAWRKAGGGRSDIRPCSASAGRGGSMGALCGLGIVPCVVKNDEDEDDDDAKSSMVGTSVDFFLPKMLVRFDSDLTEVAFASCERARTWPCDEVIGSSSSPECVIRCPMGANDVLTACGGGNAESVLNWEGNTSCEFPTVKEALRKLLLLLLDPGPLTLVRRRGDISPLEVIIDATGDDDRSPLCTVCDPEVYMTNRER